MLTLTQFAKKIEQLTYSKKYQEAVNYFKEYRIYFTKEQLQIEKNLISNLLKCLRKTNQFDGGIIFLEILNISIDENSSGTILNSYGWLLGGYFKAITTNQGKNIIFKLNESQVFTLIEKLIPFLYSNYSSFTNTLISYLFNLITKYEKNKVSKNWNVITNFCDNFDPYKLNNKSETLKLEVKGRKKDVVFASAKENWFAIKTKALFELGYWQECLDLSNEALEVLDEFNYFNDTWFARRVALSKKNLGNTEDTIDELKKILKKKKEWFIQKELAELYLLKGEIDTAFNYAIQAVNNFGPLSFKIGLLKLIGQILEKKDEKLLAFKHLSLSKLIREDEDWKVPPSLKEELNKYVFHEITQKQLKKLKSELKAYWATFDSFKSSSIRTRNKDTKLEGTIDKILNDNERGKDGFLKSGNDKYYFTINARFRLAPRVHLGAKVQFIVVDSNKRGKKQAKIIGFS
jgi:tetratricopeptide (TPR) repeat protein